MKPDQVIRGLAIGAVTAGFAVRVISVGNGGFEVLGYQVTAFALYLAAVILLALPETIDMLPFGPTRGKN